MKASAIAARASSKPGIYLERICRLQSTPT
jgi:hypothetical protein